jgi:uncharacterized protein (DUF885 family)
VEADPQVLLVLIALRLSSKRPTPANDEPLKTLKKPLQLAKDQGLIIETEVTALDKKGKPTKKTTRVVDLTERGAALLQTNASADVQAAMAARQQAALREQLEADRATLRQEVVAALSAKSKSKTGDSAKVVADLAKAVTQMADRLAKLESTLQSGTDDALLARIDEAFAALQRKLASAITSPASGATVAPPQAAQESLAVVLRRAYRTLRQFAEFNDGLVPIPRLYHETRRSLPNLSVEALQRELQSLWDRRELELKVLNEVRSATEPDKGITRGQNLYYFVFWKNA